MPDIYTAPGQSSQYKAHYTGFEALGHRLREQEQRQDDAERARTLRSAAISSGGLTIKDGGSITVRDGGVVRAEEVHDAGLTDLVVYDADGNPDALSYDRFPAALLALLHRQQDQIDTMRAELDELRARLAQEA